MPWYTTARTVLRRVLLGLAIGWLVVIVVGAVSASWLPIADYRVPTGETQVRPGRSWPEVFGTDQIGRSLLSRIVHGARVSLLVGVLSVGLALLVGCTLGLVAGARRGWVDRLVGLLSDTLLAFPPLVLLLTISAVVGPSITNLVLALAALMVPPFIRLTRANTLAVSEREFVTAARAIGSGPARVMLREILPVVLPPLAAYAFTYVAVVIALEGALSFLGLGLPPPAPTWGNMIAAGKDYLNSTPHLVFVPSGIMLLTISSLGSVAEWCRARWGFQGAG